MRRSQLHQENNLPAAMTVCVKGVGVYRCQQQREVGCTLYGSLFLGRSCLVMTFYREAMQNLRREAQWPNDEIHGQGAFRRIDEPLPVRSRGNGM